MTWMTENLQRLHINNHQFPRIKPTQAGQTTATAGKHQISLLFCSSFRLNPSRTFKHPKWFLSPTLAPSAVGGTPDSRITPGDRRVYWKGWPPARSPHPLLRHSTGVPREPVAAVGQRGRSRGRRHAHGGGVRGHGHLMRAGCVLGTCQVQNLSHRLYQLIGPSGRENSSPINPRSPHSFG